ncbi:MAG: ATP-binding protein [Coriobacteriia bacterium]
MSAPRRLSAVARVALGTAIVLVLGVAAVTGVSYAAVSRNLQAEVDRSLLQESNAFAAAVRQDAPTTQTELVDSARLYLQGRLQSGSGSAPILLVRLSDGQVVSNSDIRIEIVWDGAGAPVAEGFDTITFEGVEYRAASSPVLAADGNVLGTFHAVLSLDAALAIRDDLGRTLLVIGLGVALLGALLSFAVARTALAPLARVAATADLVTQARLTERIDYDGPDDEVGTMVRALNGMLERLEGAFGEQRQFVADASHELRTPLAIIRGHIELLERAEALPGSCAEPLAVLREETRRMQHMVDDLLVLARLDDRSQTRAFQPLDVDVLLSEVASRARGLGATRVTRTAPANVWVSGDPDLLEQALMNLVTNAMAAAGPDGRITITASATGTGVRISVADDGPGFDPDDLARVFDRFYRAPGPRSGETGGSGLGLAITRRLVEVHGGSVSAANVPGGGAEVSLELPRIEPG